MTALSRFAPGLEHQYRPQPIAPIAATGQVLLPQLAYGLRVDQPAAAQTLLGQQIVGPVAQRAAQPPDVDDLELAEESESLPSQTGTHYRTAAEGRTMQ